MIVIRQYRLIRLRTCDLLNMLICVAPSAGVMGSAPEVLEEHGAPVMVDDADSHTITESEQPWSPQAAAPRSGVLKTH